MSQHSDSAEDGWDKAFPLHGTAQEDVEPELPRPLRREVPLSDPYPIEALGDVLGNAALAIHDKVQAPKAICAQSVLAVASLAVQSIADVELPNGSVRPSSLYCATVASSGERKTTVDEVALWPVRRREEKLRSKYDTDIAEFEIKRDAHLRQREQILRSKADYPTVAVKEQALRDMGPAPPAPLVPMLTCPEPTFEGLVKLFELGHPSMGLFSSEGGMFTGGHAMNEDNRLKTGAALSALWDGEAVKRVRQGDGATILPGRRLSKHLMLQPSAATKFISDPTLQDQGLLSRVLITYPPSTSGSRYWHEPAPETEGAIKRYYARALDILEMSPVLADGKTNQLAPRRLILSEEARQIWIGFADHVENLIKPGGELEAVLAFANKLPEHAARIAAVITLFENHFAEEVPTDRMSAGTKLAEFYASEALRLVSIGQTHPDLILAEQLLTWLQTKWQEPLISLPDVYRNGPGAIRDKKAATRIVKLLEDHGWLSAIGQPAVVAGENRRDVWRIVSGDGR